MNWTKIILAAGRSSRMGFPKALAMINGAPLINQQVKVGHEAGADSVAVVTGYHECRIRQSLGELGDDVEFIRNPDPSGDQTSSMKQALDRLGTDQGVVMALVDHPVISPEPIETVLPATLTPNPFVRVPTHGARRGHPPYFSPGFLDRIREMDPDRGINHLYRDEDVTVEEIPVESPSVLVDIDSPADLFEHRRIQQ